MSLLRSHWFWFFAILTLVGGFDYYDHISRPGSSFAEAPGAWFGFTAGSHITLCVIAFVVAKAAGRLPVPSLVADTLGVGCAVAAHLLATGPFWDRLFWNGNLMFDNIAFPIAVGCVLYLFYRGIFAFASMLRFKPQSRA